MGSGSARRRPTRTPPRPPIALGLRKAYGSGCERVGPTRRRRFIAAPARARRARVGRVRRLALDPPLANGRGCAADVDRAGDLGRLSRLASAGRRRTYRSRPRPVVGWDGGVLVRAGRPGSGSSAPAADAHPAWRSGRQGRRGDRVGRTRDRGNPDDPLRRGSGERTCMDRGYRARRHRHRHPGRPHGGAHPRSAMLSTRRSRVQERLIAARIAVRDPVVNVGCERCDGGRGGGRGGRPRAEPKPRSAISCTDPSRRRRRAARREPPTSARLGGVRTDTRDARESQAWDSYVRPPRYTGIHTLVPMGNRWSEAQ